MPDSTTLPIAEGGRTADGGKTNWPLMLGAGGAGVVVLILLLRRQSATGTTSGQTSINAALGSIQEQNLNLLGEMSQNDRALGTELGSVNNNVISGLAGINALGENANNLNWWLGSRAALQAQQPGSPAAAAGVVYPENAPGASTLALLLQILSGQKPASSSSFPPTDITPT